MKAALLAELERALAEPAPVVLATVLEGPGAGNQLLLRTEGVVAGGLGDPGLDAAAARIASELFAERASRRQTLTTAGAPVELFFEHLAPPPELIVVGAVHVAIPLVTFARVLGYATTVIDPRGAFATAERFAEADRLIREWPAEALAEVGLHEGSCVAVLSHDLKLDLPALEVALRSPARYIGALGSKKTQAKRVVALAEKGFTTEEIARIHSPIGLDLGGGRRAEEIALSVIAEIVRASHGR